jgi:hypothetical protein
MAGEFWYSCQNSTCPLPVALGAAGFGSPHAAVAAPAALRQPESASARRNARRDGA